MLEEAVARLRMRPEAEQEQAAEALLDFLGQEQQRYQLTPDQVEEVRQIQEGLADGSERLATDEEVAAMWRRHGA